MLKLYLGDMERYGLPKPDHRFGNAHPTVSDDILSRMAHGTITAKPNIASLTRTGVRFADGSEVEADVVVYCTGYKVTFPFFEPELIAAPGNDLPLFRRVFHPDIPDVYFIGLLQPLGAIMPLAELQSEWVCDHLAGRYELPPRHELRADIEAERRAMFKRYVASPRHTMQVDFEDYVLGVRRERRRGARRAVAE
jgi:dimethylaniline monooxygenase (N-oxide forming)